jgi:hypothetical protein
MSSHPSATTLIELSSNLRRANVQLCFLGPFTSGIVQHFGAALRVYLQQQTSDESEVTGVFSVYIEMAQNIQRYNDRNSAALAACGVGASSGIIVIGRSESRTSIVAGNWVLDAEVGELERRLKELRTLDQPALKARFKQQLRSAPSADEAAGAGLGLLTVARHGSTPIEFEFMPGDRGVSYYSLSVEV